MNMRETLVQKHWQELLEKGRTTCDSPILRKMLYERLEKYHIPFTSEKVGDTGTPKGLNPYVHRGLGYSPKRAMTWLRQGRLYQADLQDAFEYFSKANVGTYNHLTLDDMNALFDERTSKDTKFEILTRICDVPNKYGYLDFVPLHKLVKTIHADRYALIDLHLPGWQQAHKQKRAENLEEIMYWDLPPLQNCNTGEIVVG